MNHKDDLHTVNDAKEQTCHYLNQLLGWLESNGWAGWDPYDVFDNRLGMWMGRRENIYQRVANGITSRVNDYFPLTLRKILRVKPRINAKAMGLFAAAFLQLETCEKVPRQINGEPGYVPCFRWLEENKVEKFGGCVWGYPFDWQSRILIPRNTPTVVNSAIIGDAYWLKYKYHHDETALKQCENICEFILKGLQRSGYKKDGSFCFSYTPVDTFQVHNANLFGAEFLVRVGSASSRDDWVETGIAAANFSISEIREDGTLNYWSNEQAIGVQQDIYHSGFEIRALDGIANSTGLAKFRHAADHYFKTWLRDFFSEDGSPCLGRGQTDIIEVHSCAEALLCASKMADSKIFSKELYLKYVTGVLNASDMLWMQKDSDRGYFASKKRHVLGFDVNVNIPYIRWGQAWMFRALSEIIAMLNER
ncbi:MAG TPA: hypothetical protein PLA32_11515 [Smithella sp.]|jgi:hypothetical protein|nr:hypothetical protein [Smithella sp.]